MEAYLHVLPLKEGAARASFDLYLPANSGENGEYYTCYHFLYEKNPTDPSLSYAEGPNNPANREFYRIRTAFVVRKTEEGFLPVFRALQQGEIGFAFREVGAGDFVGGLHGDEVLTEVGLVADEVERPLTEPFFGTVRQFSFSEESVMYRCNTPECPLIRHTQAYSFDVDREADVLRLRQRVEWLADAKPLQAAYLPMLTAQRLDHNDPSRILSDTVEFYGADGTLVRSFDTTPYGTDGGGKSTVMVCEGTKAKAVRVYGKESGFSAEAGYTVLNGSIPEEQQAASLCIRYMKNTFDNKIYFNVGRECAPTRGTVWESAVFYAIRYTSPGKERNEK